MPLAASLTASIMDLHPVDDKLLQIQSLYRLRVYLYAFDGFLRSLPPDERYAFRLQRGIEPMHYCKDMIQLVEGIIADYASCLSRFSFDDLPAD